MNKLKGATIAMGMLAVVSCNTKQGTGSLIGAGGGAIIGGIIGKLAGNITTFFCIFALQIMI